MPYCSQCGNQVAGRDVFCARCGARQPQTAAPPPPQRPAGDPLANLSPRTASILCYIPGVGWVASIVVLAADKFRTNRQVRFDAFQGLYLFVAWLVEDWVLRPFLTSIPHVHLHSLARALLLGASIFMMVKASNQQRYALPFIGELAERSANE